MVVVIAGQLGADQVQPDVQVAGLFGPDMEPVKHEDEPTHQPQEEADEHAIQVEN